MVVGGGRYVIFRASIIVQAKRLLFTLSIHSGSGATRFALC